MIYKLIRTEKDMLEALESLDESKLLFCDTETCPEYGKTNLAKKPGGLYGAIRLFQTYQSGDSQALLFDFFFVDQTYVLDYVQKLHQVYHNASYDLHTINCHTDYVYLPVDVSDTFYLSKSVYPTKERFDFYSCLAHADLEDDAIRNIDKKANQTSDWSKALTEEQLLYAAYDVLYLSLLHDKVKDGMDEACILDHDNLKYAIEYDRLGMPVDRSVIRTMKQEAIASLEDYQSRIPVNINSPKQCKEWLGSTGTDAELLGTMALEGNSMAEDLLMARKQDKFLMFLNKYDGDRIKGFHNACGARTSRMSCNGGDRLYYENLQNPPHLIFPALHTTPDNIFVYKDYSGLELRMVTAYVGEPTMAKLYMEGEDLHTYTGCRLFNKTPETLTFDERTVTKFFNFGTAYGAGPAVLRGLLRGKGRINMSFEKVQNLRENWLEIYGYYGEWHRMHKKMMNVYGYIDTTTALGREIRAYNLTDSFNFPIQGSAAEVTKLAVHYLYQRYKKPNVVNVVHDSIAMEHPVKSAEQWVERLNECMLDAWYYVIKDLAIPDLPMPPEAKLTSVWP